MSAKNLGRAPWYSSSCSTAPPKPFIIGVTGGSASGKTSVCEAIVNHLSVPWVGLLSMDRYYNIGDRERELAAQGLYNFDHPDAFDMDRLYDDIIQLKEGKAVDVPIYDFCTHSRTAQTDRMYGVDIVIVEGILLFYAPKVRELLDLKIYVDTDNDLRLARRIRRDIVERGRSVDSVLDQYQRTVKPSFEQFIQPTKRFADLIIPWNDRNVVAVDILTQHIRGKLDQRQAIAMQPAFAKKQNNIPQQINEQEQQPQKQEEDLQITAEPGQHVEKLFGAGTPTLSHSASPATGAAAVASGILIHSPSLQPHSVLEVPTKKQSLPVMVQPDATRRLSLSRTPGSSAAPAPSAAASIPPMSLDTIQDIPTPLPSTSKQQPRPDELLAKGTSGFFQFSSFAAQQHDPNTLPKDDRATIEHLKKLYQESYTRYDSTTAINLKQQATALYPENFPQNLLVLPPTKSLTAIHTVLRNKNTTINDFRFAMSRLVRIICTQAMNLVTYTPKPIVTPTNAVFNGLNCQSSNVVAVSIVRAGEAFEQSAREVIKDIAIGKIVIQHPGQDKSTGPRLYYAKLPIVNNPETKILLFDGVLSTGSAVIMAIHVLLDHGAKPENIIFCCATAAPEGIYNVSTAFPSVRIVSSSLEKGLDKEGYAYPGLPHFSDRYYGSMPSSFTTTQ